MTVRKNNLYVLSSLLLLTRMLVNISLACVRHLERVFHRHATAKCAQERTQQAAACRDTVGAAATCVPDPIDLSFVK